MQNNTIPYIVGLIVVVLVGFGAWMMLGNSGAPTGDTGDTGTPQSQSTSLTNLIAMSGSHKCTFDSSTQNSESSGTVYISGGQMRGDFTSVAAGQTTESHMIVKDNTSYVWSDAMQGGIKMSFDAMATQSDANPQSTLDPNANVDYSCSAWSVDVNVFTLPAGVTFQDMSALIPNGTSGASVPVGAGTTVDKSEQCKSCDSAPDAETRAQCRVWLSCN